MAISPPPTTPSPRVRERARIERFVHSGEGGFRIAELRLADGREATALGRMGELQVREIALLEGTWIKHDRYGEQLRVDRAAPDDLRDPEAVQAYLALTPHVTHRKLHALLDAAGDGDPLAYVDEDPLAAFTAAGMGERHAAAAATDWQRRLALRRLRAWLQPRGLGRLVPGICTRGGTRGAEKALADPYLLAERYEVPLQVVDELVDAPDPARRSEAAVICVLRDAARGGHTGMPPGELALRVAELGADGGEETLSVLRKRGAIRVGDALVQPQLLATQEDEIAEAFRTLAEEEITDPVSDEELADYLTDEQRAAVHGAFARRLTVIVGGPGTGKSTLIGEIVALAERHELRVGLCAPTGKAARRLTQTTDREAQTIHALAKVAPPEDSDPWDITARTDPRLRGAGPDEEFDVLVCDEASMLTCELTAMLLACLGDDTHLVLVGDADQLPPVGPGDVLEAVVDHPGSPVFSLTEIKRQAGDSVIPVVARRVLEGERPQVDLPEGAPRDFWLSIQPNAAAVHERAIALASGGMAQHLGVDPVWGVQVLAPTNHELDILNGRLQQLLNPDGRRVPETNLRVGDKLLQTLNAREQGLVNGDLLRLDGLERGGARLRLAFEDGTRNAISAKLAHRLRPAYAMTAHRAQGSEFPGVIVVLTAAAARPLNRNWLYTAITRAQRACVVVAEERALDLALARGIRGTRWSGLGARLDAPT
ncbi:MAG: AAA family ATPase [Solirubrobacteraceae bacterium]|nr:AAA family ATPase [Solirubrobacteraceae bacterium]